MYLPLPLPTKSVPLSMGLNAIAPQVVVRTWPTLCGAAPRPVTRAATGETSKTPTTRPTAAQAASRRRGLRTEEDRDGFDIGSPDMRGFAPEHTAIIDVVACYTFHSIDPRGRA